MRSLNFKTMCFDVREKCMQSLGFPVGLTAPNLILNIPFQSIFVHRIKKSQPFFREINSFLNYNHAKLIFPYAILKKLKL